MNARLLATVFVLLTCWLTVTNRPLFPQEEDDNEAESRKTAERFLMILERNPRRGTALDKVVEYHLDHESLDTLIAQLREKAESTEDEDAGRAWLVVGLIEASQGDAEDAHPALERADELLPKNAVASFSLGQNLMTLKRWDAAAAALERAIQRKPAPTDLLDMFQTLGRVQQRLAPDGQVVEVWNRLEQLVPNDPRVPELIAKTLLDDGHWEAALPRFEALAKATKDLYRRSEFELEAVDLRLKLGQFERAVAEADRLLAGLKPDHWLFRETRRRVDEAYLANDDTTGLIKHYEQRLTQQPDDLDAIVRLSRTLVSSERHKDARARLEAGIKLAPTSVELRLELIELLQSDQQFAEAISQYEQLDRIAPNHPDYVRDWGFLILKFVVPPSGGEVLETQDRLKAERQASKAAAIWRKLVEAKPQDATVAAQVAGLMASADKSLLGNAAELLRRAVELEPDVLSHREQLGEVLDADGKKEASLAAWRSMAEGTRRNANNLAQLAEVLSRFGYRDESLAEIDAACELDRKSLELRFQQAELRRKWKQAEAAMAALAEAASLADTPETFDRVVQLEVKVLSESELLSERIEALQAELATNSEGGGRKAERDEDKISALRIPYSALQHFRLAKYLEAADNLREATVAARQAVELDSRNGVFLQTAARLLTQDSQWLSAIELYERLLKLDRRFRIDSLRSIAELEQKLGRKDKALKAGRDLLAAAPGNPEVAEFVADTFLRFNQNADALQILRRASRQNVADKRLALKLVERLMEEGGSAKAEGGMKTASVPPSALRVPNSLDESREVLWRVFEQTAKSDDRIEVVRKLGELATFPGEFVKLTQRLERHRTDPKLRRDASLALVQVHEQAGDTQQARRELERWLPQAPRDAVLLARMVSLCEAAGDLEAAITHQRRLAEVTRKRETDEHLVLLLRRAGRDQEADLLATRWLESERDPVKVLKEIDQLLTTFSDPSNRREKASLELALKLTQSWRDRDPQNWEFLVRQALAYVALFETEKANVVRDEILKLDLPDDTPSVLVSMKTSSPPVTTRIDQVRRRFSNNELPLVDYGQARRIAIDGRLLFGTYWLSRSRPGNANERPELPAAEGKSKLRQAWDTVYALSLKSPDERLLPACLELNAVAAEDVATDWLSLRALAFLRQESLVHFIESQPMLNGTPLDSKTLDRLLASFRRLMKHDETLEWSWTISFPELLARELLRAGRADELTTLRAELEATNSSLNSLAWLITQAARRNDADDALRLMKRYAEIIAANPHQAAAVAGLRNANADFIAWWMQNLMARPDVGSANATPSKERVLRILDDTWTTLSETRLPPRSSHAFNELVQIVGSQLIARKALPRQVTPLQMQSMASSGQGWLVWRDALTSVPLTVEFPEVTQASEITALRLLLQAHALASDGKVWTDELRQHMQSKLKRAEPGSREEFLAQWGLACLLVWDDKNNEALPVMRALFELAAQQPKLQENIAWFHQRYGSQEVALELFDRIETNDGQLRKEIEQRAVALAGKLGRVDRVRIAAERLFGMKLEPQEELQLAGTLSGLGLHEHAEAIRQRLPQRAGNNLAVLQQAMQERIDAQKIEEACQIAEQIIRRTTPANTLIGSVQQSTFGGGQQARVITATSTARTKALALLGQQGKLGPLIEQAEQQFDRSPQSLKLFGQLAELYGAEQPPQGGTTNSANAKIAKLLVRMADSEAPDPQFRLTLARALVSAGKADLAVPHFLFAIEKLPNATAQVLFEAEQILSELGHADKLAAIVLKSKLAVNDQQRIELFRRIVQRLHGPPIRAKLIIELFEKAFREAPEFRPVLSAQLLALGGSVWNQEELWPLARDLAVPPKSFKNVSSWYGIDVIGKPMGGSEYLLTSQVIDLAKQLGKLDELELHAIATMKLHPNWSVGGNVTLGLIKLRRQGEAAQAKPLVGILLRIRQGEQTGGTSLDQTSNFESLCCRIGRELAVVGEFDAATQFYEQTTAELALEECRVFGRVAVMQQLAVRIVNRLLAKLNDPNELVQQAGSPLFIEAAKITAEINQPYVAARLAQAMITRWQLPGANNSDGGTWLEQLDQRFGNSLAAIKPAMLPEIVVRTPTSERPDVGVRTTPTIDLLPHITGDSLATLRLNSPFVSLIREAAKDKDLWTKWTAQLAKELRRDEGHRELSLAILAALSELNTQPSGALKTSEGTAIASLVEIAKRSLKDERSRTAPAGFHPQLGLWLVARECLIRNELKAVGEQFAELATESASRHFDPRFQWAILRERGELAAKSGNNELARALWSRLTKDVLRPRSAEDAVPMRLGQQFVWSANWPNTRLQRARELCRMTLAAEMSDLSLAIFRDAVIWPKTALFQSSVKLEPGQSALARSDMTVDSQSIASSAEDILATWDALEPEWRAKGVAADAIFTTLLECVLPTSRPDEVFAFAVGISVVRTPTSERSGERPDVGVRSTSSSSHPQSLAQRLVQIAVAEKRIDTLTQRLAEREKTATNSLGLRLIHLLLTRQTNDEQRLDAELTELARHDWSKPTAQDARVATQIVGLLSPLTERRDAVGKLFEQWIGPLGKAFPRDEHPLADVRRLLARRQLDETQFDKAKETIASHLRHMDQVWSASGAMDGQHLRRLELLAIATEYANAGLTRESIELLAQVADARWPDRYPDENPGAVLAILEAKLKSRPAQERYELWRAWSLPNDGVKSMRMLTGAVEGKLEARNSKLEGDADKQKSDSKSQISNLKSTGLLLVEAAREADRLAEVDAFVEDQMKARPSDRIHVLLALVHFANKSPAVAEPLLRQQLASGVDQTTKTAALTRTRVWDDLILATLCRRHESLKALATELAQRASQGATELKDSAANSVLAE